MTITNKQPGPGTSNQVVDPAKTQSVTLDEIKSFHESLESERIHRVLVRWRKRKRDEDVSNGTAILEKILQTLHEEFEARKERAKLWDQALVAELKPERAQQELGARAAASTLSLEKQTKIVHSVASVLNIEVSGEEMSRILSKTTVPTSPAGEAPHPMPPTPPAERRSPATPHEARPPQVGTHVRESDPKRLPVTPRISGLAPRPDSHGGSRDRHTTPSQGLRPLGPADVSSLSLLLRILSTDTLVQEDQVTNPERDGRSLCFNATEQETENRWPVGSENKHSRQESYPSGSQSSCVRLKKAEAGRWCSRV